MSNKYHNDRVRGYQSGREAEGARELRLLQKAGKIQGLLVEHLIPGSPCERCRRDTCPPVFFPGRDFDQSRGRETRLGPLGSAAPTGDAIRAALRHEENGGRPVQMRLDFGDGEERSPFRSAERSGEK